MLNEAGTIVSGEALKQLDTDGMPIKVEGKILTSKGKQAKTYQTPYGSIAINHHVYQYQGLADGEPENWAFLNTVTDTQTVDFYHATQYLDKIKQNHLLGIISPNSE